MWITCNGSLCYFSQKEDKRLVLFDGHEVHDAEVVERTSSFIARPFSFQICLDSSDCHDKHCQEATFACDTAEEMKTWLYQLEQSKLRFEQTMHLTTSVVDDLKKFRLTVLNRRQIVVNAPLHKYQAHFKDILFKVKTDGDLMNEKDWFEREMWLAANGTLVYFSKREQRELIFYTAEDIARVSMEQVPDQSSCKQFAFKAQLRSDASKIEYAPAIFAARTAEARRTVRDVI